MAKSSAADASAASVKTESKTEANPPTFPPRVMYLGPSMSEDGKFYQQGRIFNNGLPLDWMERAVLEPEFRQLLVAVDDVPKAMAELVKPTSMRSLARDTVLKNYNARNALRKEKR